MFRAAWEKGNRVTSVYATDIDRVLHIERLDHGRKRLHRLRQPLRELPDGAMVQRGAESYLIAQGRALRWSSAGYSAADIADDNTMLLTPPSTLRALAAAYRPLERRKAAAATTGRCGRRANVNSVTSARPGVGIAFPATLQAR
jgi:hypothetical protein